MSLRSLLTLAPALAAAQIWPFPDMSGEIKCDGTIRPDYQECEDVVIPKTFDGATVGPGFAEGDTFQGEKCRIRTLKCIENDSGSFELSDVSSMYGLIRNECAEFPAGGAYRSGDACVLVDDPNNPLKKREVDEFLEQQKRSNEERKAKEARRAAVESLTVEKRCENPPSPCYTYNEGTFITNVRGIEKRVCDNILPDGARCDKTKSVTTSQSFTTEVNIGVGIEEVVDAGASFSAEVGTSSTETLTTAITIDCDGGSGYIVWYPLMQVSRGECGRGPEETCNGGCITDTRTQCEFRKPVLSGDGRLSGEYDVQCV